MQHHIDTYSSVFTVCPHLVIPSTPSSKILGYDTFGTIMIDIQSRFNFSYFQICVNLLSLIDQNTTCLSYFK